MKKWSEQQVNMLNELQVGIRYGHPYTCPNRSDENNHFHNGNDLGCLVATEHGWVCPSCSYTQDWLNTVDIHPDSIPLLQDVNSRFNVEKDEQKEKEQNYWLTYFNNYSKVNLKKQLSFGWIKIDDVLNIVKHELYSCEVLKFFVEGALSKSDKDFVLCLIKEILRVTKETTVNNLLEKMNETN
jgi:hypothetical protein